jgi:hypothetical protein
MKVRRGRADAKARKAAAALLQQQISDLTAGRTKPATKPSFRDFIEEKMAEDRDSPQGRKPRATSSEVSGAKPDDKIS